MTKHPAFTGWCMALASLIFKEAQVIAYFDLDDCAKIAQGIALSLEAAENKDDRQAG
jgi:hypothetical protein